MSWRKGNRVKLVPENEAQESTRAIYEEIKKFLGLPYVDTYFQALAYFPKFLELHWRAVHPLVDTQEFFLLAERLRADAYTRIHSYFEVPDIGSQLVQRNFSTGACEELTYVSDLFHYSAPLILLLTAAQFQAFDSPAGNAAASHPAKPIRFERRPVLISEEVASPAAKHIYEDVKRTLDLPFIGTPFQALARWPEFFALFWESLKPAVQSPVFEGCHYGIRETAFALTRELPVVVDLSFSELSESGLAAADAASIVRITEFFVNALSNIVLCIAYARIAIEGGTGHGIAPRKEPQSEKQEKAGRAA